MPAEVSPPSPERSQEDQATAQLAQELEQIKTPIPAGEQPVHDQHSFESLAQQAEAEASQIHSGAIEDPYAESMGQATPVEKETPNA